MDWLLQERCQTEIFSSSFLKKCGPEEVLQGQKKPLCCEQGSPEHWSKDANRGRLSPPSRCWAETGFLMSICCTNLNQLLTSSKMESLWSCLIMSCPLLLHRLLMHLLQPVCLSTLHSEVPPSCEVFVSTSGLLCFGDLLHKCVLWLSLYTCPQTRLRYLSSGPMRLIVDERDIFLIRIPWECWASLLAQWDFFFIFPPQEVTLANLWFRTWNRGPGKWVTVQGGSSFTSAGRYFSVRSDGL